MNQEAWACLSYGYKIKWVGLPQTGNFILPYFFRTPMFLLDANMKFSQALCIFSIHYWLTFSLLPLCSTVLQRWRWRRQQTDTSCTCRRRTHWFSWRRTGHTSSATTTSRCVPHCETWCSASCRNSDLNLLHASLFGSFWTVLLLYCTVDSNTDDGGGGGHDEEPSTGLSPPLSYLQHLQ